MDTSDHIDAALCDTIGDAVRLSTEKMIDGGMRPESAMFVHLPDGDDAVRPRLITYHRDCIRAAIGAVRARTGVREIHLLLMSSFQPGALLERYPGIRTVFAEDPHLRVCFCEITHGHDNDIRRIGAMAACLLGGIAGCGTQTDHAAWWAGEVCAGEHKRVYMPMYHTRPDRAWTRRWSHPGDLLTQCDIPPLLSDLAVGCANLAGAPPVLWINLDRHEGRRRHMERQLEAYGVTWHHRVRAIDGSDPDIFARYVDGAHSTSQPGMNACSASHVLAMAQYIDVYPEEPWVVIMEDDASFELVHYWRKSLVDYMGDVTRTYPDWRTVQLGALVCDKEDLYTLLDPDCAVPRSKTNWFSTVAYAVRREAAQAMVDHYYDRNTGRVNLGVLLECESVHTEPFIFRQDTLFLPLVNFVGTDSDIDHKNPVNHGVARGYLQEFWKHYSTQLGPSV
jgi:hypothetical protein